MRVIFFGTLCTFSIAPLRILIEAGHDVGAVMIPSDQSISGHPIAPLSPPHQTPIPLIAAASEPSIVSLAWEQQLPVYQVSRLAAPETLETLATAASRCRLRGLLSQTPARRTAPRAALGLPERASVAAAAAIADRIRCSGCCATAIGILA